MQISKAADSLALQLQASVEGDLLQVSYTIANHSSAAAVAFDGATGVGAGAFPDLTGQCYVSYDKGVCRVQRIRPGPHPTMDTTRILMPSASVTEPGQTRQVKFSLRLPLKEHAEYSPDFPGAKYETRKVRQLELHIGYFLQTPETVLKPMAPGVFQVVKAAPLAQTYRASQTCPAAFDILVRTEADFLRM